MRHLAPLLAAIVGSVTSLASAACPVGLTLEVDNDTPGSGYSEVKPENWVTHSVDACKGNYRYLSAYVGDGTRKGQAIWQPTVAVAGVYEVTTSYRATSNRTNDADYLLYDDKGATLKKSVNQQLGNGCTKTVIGNAYCAVGGSCRLVLDGDDGKSDAADVTTFTLSSCDDPGDAGTQSPCGAIAANTAYELCQETSSTCAGVFTDGSGCSAFCAAAGMVCVARFGGEPGCQKEPQSPIPCGASNGHASDFCECELPPGGADAGVGGAAGSGATGSGASGGTPGGGSSGTAGGASGGTSAGGGGSPASGGASALEGGVVEDDSGCGCRATRTSTLGGSVWLAAALIFARRQRRKAARQRRD